MSSNADDVRRIAESLPQVIPGKWGISFQVDGGKAFTWTWKKRVEPKKARVPNLGVLAVRVADGNEKAVLLAADPDKFFTEPHYNGYPAVLVRLAAVTARDLKPLIFEAWRSQAPKDVLEEPPRPTSQRKHSSRKPRRTAPRKPQMNK